MRAPQVSRTTNKRDNEYMYNGDPIPYIKGDGNGWWYNYLKWSVEVSKY